MACVVRRLVTRWPARAEHVKGPFRTFPMGIHGDDGTGLSGDPCLVVTWSVAWKPAKGLTTWKIRFPIVVMPHGRALPETFPAIMAAIVSESGALLR